VVAASENTWRRAYGPGLAEVGGVGSAVYARYTVAPDDEAGYRNSRFAGQRCPSCAFGIAGCGAEQFHSCGRHARLRRSTASIPCRGSSKCRSPAGQAVANPG